MKRFIAICIAVALSGCSTTMHTAIASAREADACHRACPNTGSDESLLACIRSCPGTSVYDDQECRDTQLAQGQVCVERKRDEFSTKRTLILVGSIVVGVALAGGTIAYNELVLWR